jgi:hypothetical protein
MWIYTCAPPYAFMAYCLNSFAQGQFNLHVGEWLSSRSTRSAHVEIAPETHCIGLVDTRAGRNTMAAKRKILTRIEPRNLTDCSLPNHFWVKC